MEEFMEKYTDTLFKLDQEGKLDDVKDKENNTITFKNGMEKLTENGYFVKGDIDALRKYIDEGGEITPEVLKSFVKKN